ncbi:MAG TPA: oligosaccharide flippase family protein, partial [Gemmatimonadales bacterium]|nr:oligosaccharide flippase family protein [Gemmatimonadales bacterium]
GGPRALLARDLEFSRLAWIDAGEALVWSTTTLVGAGLGLGYWALVLGAVVSGAVAMVVLCIQRPHQLSWPRDLRSIAHAMHLGWYVVVSQLCWYVYSHADLTIVGRVLGTAPLGAYTKGSDVASIPADRISTLVGQVTPAVFSAAQNDKAALRRYLLAVTEGLALLTFPMSVGLALVADLFVITVLGEQWRSAIVPLRLLGLYGGFRSIFNPLPQMLIATGNAKLNMRFNLVAAVAIPSMLYLGSRWGITGVAVAWIVGCPVVIIPLFFRRTLRLLGIPAADYLRTLWPAASAAAGIAAAVLLVRPIVPDAWSPWLQLGIRVLAGAVAYAAVLFLAHRTRMKEVAARVLDIANGRRRPTPSYATAPSESRARLFLISYHFPPDPAVGALRWQKLARYAAERGWGLDVLTLHPAELEASDPARLADLPKGVRIYGIPRPRVRAEQVGVLVWHVYDAVRRLRQRIARGGPARVERTPESRSRAEVRWRPFRLRDVTRAYYAWLDHAVAGRWAEEGARCALTLFEPGVHRAVISCGPPHMAHEGARRLARATGLPFIMDLRDPWSLMQRLPEAVASPAWFWLAQRHERRAVSQAALIVANTEPLRNVMRGVYRSAASRIIAVPNGFDDEPLPPALSRPGRRFTIAYAGTIYLDRDPRVLFRAAARLITDRHLTPRDFGIELMGHVQSLDGVGIEHIARDEGIADYVRAVPPRPRREALEFLSRASMLLVLPQDSDMAIPAKVFDYMRYDAWMLALADPGSAVEQLLRPSGADIVAPDALDTLSAVLQLRYIQHLRGERPVRLSVNEHYGRRAQADRLFSAIEAITGTPPRPEQKEASVLCVAS